MATTTANAAKASSVKKEWFSCGICLELLVEPTTILCGHNFCRLCLAEMFLSSGRNDCPMCRETWSGVPKVNTALRDMIMGSFPEESEARYEEYRTNSETNAETLMKFDRLLNRRFPQPSKPDTSASSSSPRTSGHGESTVDDVTPLLVVGGAAAVAAVGVGVAFLCKKLLGPSSNSRR